jgi:HAD superfamily phosphatase
MDRLACALRAAMKPRGLLFDLDGVLADVSGSYRQAIIETAASFGVRVTREAIAAAKAAGNANNDWVLTQRLLAASGVEAGLEEVTRRFETLYQGDGRSPGLRETERLLVERGQLQRWASQRPLAIVTGRPRVDAERFLERFGISDCFRVLVCMEDAPLKPDPSPVRLAMERLGIEHAWMIGDTVDDVLAARGAGVIPVGIAAPGEDLARATDTLTRAGAARVLSATSRLSELLS